MRSSLRRPPLPVAPAAVLLPGAAERLIAVDERVNQTKAGSRQDPVDFDEALRERSVPAVMVR